MLKQITASIVIGVALGAVGTKAYLEKYTSKSTESTKERVVTVSKETRTKDGTVVVETHKTEDRKIKETVVAAQKLPDWRLTAGSDFKQYHRLELQRRIVGPAHVGIWADTNKSLGLSVGFEF